MRVPEAASLPPSIPSRAFAAHWPGLLLSRLPHVALEVIQAPSQGHGWSCGPLDSPSIEGVLPGEDVCALPAHEELDAVIEGEQVLLGHRGLGLLDDVQRVRGAQAQRVDMTEWLEAAVRVHAVHQAICGDDRA